MRAKVEEKRRLPQVNAVRFSKKESKSMSMVRLFHEVWHLTSR